MPTVQQLLSLTDLYRNSYSADTKVYWMDSVQRQIFQDVPHEALPYTFTTVANYSFYQLPNDCDLLGIKRVTIETEAGTDRYKVLPYIPLKSNERFSDTAEFFTVEANQNLFLNPMPTPITEGKKVYIYYNKRPEGLTALNLAAIPDLEEDFHELLVLGTKAKIAEARGEFDDKAEFDAAFARLYQQYLKRYKFNYPEYPKTRDVMTPMRRGAWAGSSRRSGGANWDLIPY